MVVASVEHPLVEQSLGEPLLVVRDLHLAYGSLKVLDGVDFQVRAGELVALTGENGAGKSTIVRCVAGDLAPTSGEVSFAGNRVRGSSLAVARGIAVVWQDAALCDNLDVSANLFLGREGRHWYVSETRAFRAANEALSSYGIHFPSSRAVRTLSRGQRQLISLARAMQNEPRLLVLDEPTASLGPRESSQVEELIALLKARGTAVLLVSHNMEQAFELADRILVLRRGRVAANLMPSATHPDEVVAIMSGHDPGATARHQLGRLQMLVDQLAQAKPGSSLPLILSALAASLSTAQLCIHLVQDGRLRLAAATGLQRELLEAWAELPVGPEGGPMGRVAETVHSEADEDIAQSAAWSRFYFLGRAAGVRSSWAVPVIGQRGLIAVITGCRPFVGLPSKDQVDLMSLYAGYAAGAIERDRLFDQVTTRNQVLETIREVLEALTGPVPVPSALGLALGSLQRGLRASGVELWADEEGTPHCICSVGASSQAAPPSQLWNEGNPAAQARSVSFEVPVGTAVLIARWTGAEPPEYADALLGDAAHSLRLAMERGEAERAHQEAAALRRSHQLQRDFLSRLSHELRTPLTAIRGYASSLLASDVTWDDESKARFLDRIAGESARLGRLVGDLLDFSAIESGILRLQPDWCDLGLVLEAAVACLPPERASAVSLDCPAGIAAVSADHDRLEQVFVNLLDNAFQHNGEGVHVKVKVFMQGPSTLAVRVADDGKGLPEELRSYLHQSNGPHAAVPPGAGLGLSIAAGIVAAHGGEMLLEPAPRGASFLVKLPVEGERENLAEAAT